LNFLFAGTDTSQYGGGNDTIKFVNPENKLENLIGKTIHRDVPAKNKTECDTAYQNTPYTIDSYNENIVSLRDEKGNLIILNRSLWVEYIGIKNLTKSKKCFKYP